METQTVTLTKREAAMKMSLDMIREWCCSNLKEKKAVKIAISCGKKRYEFLADHTGFVLKGKNNPDYYYTKSKVDPLYLQAEGHAVITQWYQTIYADDIVEEFTSITEEWLEENQEEICNRIDDNDASLGETIYNPDDESFSMDLAFDYCENYDGSPNWGCE